MKKLLGKFQRNLDDCLCVKGFGRYLEVSWDADLLPDDLFYTVQLIRDDSTEAILRAARIQTFQRAMILPAVSTIQCRIGIALGNMDPPRFISTFTHATHIPRPKVTQSTINSIDLSWDNIEFVELRLQFAIESRVGTGSWATVYQGGNTSCRIENLSPNSAYSFRLTITGAERLPQKHPCNKIGILWCDMEHQAHTSLAGLSLASDSIIGLTSPPGPTVLGIGTIWKFSWNPPQDYLESDSSRLSYEVILMARNKNEPTRIQTDLTEITSLNLLLDAQYQVSVHVLYQNGPNMKCRCKSQRKQFCTKFPHPVVQGTTENQVELVWDKPQMPLPRDIHFYLETEARIGWQKLCDASSGTFSMTTSLCNLIHCCRLAVDFESEDESKKRICVSDVVMCNSPTTISVAGIGPWVKLSWSTPTLASGNSSPAVPILRYIVTQDCDEGKKQVLFDGNETFLFPPPLPLDSTRFHFGVSSVLPSGSRSFARSNVYSSTIIRKVTVSAITSSSCHIYCKIQSTSPAVNIGLQYTTEIRKDEGSWHALHLGTQEEWDINDLPAHSLIHLRIRIGLNDGKRTVKNDDDIFITIRELKFMTAPSVVLVHCLGKHVELDWGRPAEATDEPIRALRYDIEAFQLESSNFVGVASCHGTKTRIAGLQYHTYYLMRVRCWTPEANLASLSPNILVLTAPEPPKVDIIRFDRVEIRWTLPSDGSLPETSRDLLDHEHEVMVMCGGYGEVLNKDGVRDEEYKVLYSAKKRHVFIAHHFSPYSNYFIRLRTKYLSAISREVCVDSTDTLIFTGKSKPMPPSAIEVAGTFAPSVRRHKASESRIVVHWKTPPRDNGSLITGYALEMSIIELDENPISGVLRKGWQGMYVGKKMKYKVNMKSLKKFGSCQLCFRLQAANHFGFSDYSEIRTYKYITMTQPESTKKDSITTTQVKPLKKRANQSHNWHKENIKQELSNTEPVSRLSMSKLYLASRGFELPKQVADQQRRKYLKKRGLP